MLLRISILFLFLLAVGNTFSQSRQKTDSIESLVKNLPTDTTKAWLLNQLVTALLERDDKKAITYAQQAKDLSTILNYRRGIAHALTNLGWIHYRKGDYAKTFSMSKEALEIAESLNDSFITTRALINIGVVYFEQKQMNLAIAHIERAKRISIKTNDYATLSRIYNNQAFFFLGKRQFDSTRFYVEKGIRISKKIRNQYLVGMGYRLLGDLALSQGQYQAALQQFYVVDSIAQQLDNKFLQLSTGHRVGKTLALQGKRDEALIVLHAVREAAMTVGYKDELERTLKLIIENYTSLNQLDKAFEYQQQYLVVHDSLLAQRSSEQIELLKIRFDSEMQQSKIELLTREAELKQDQLNTQRIWMAYSVGLMILLASLAFLLFHNNRQKKKVNQALQSRNQEVQAHAQQLSNLNRTKDKLFSIISHDLRSPLASLRGLMDVLSHTTLTPEEFIQSSNKIRRNLDSVQEDLDNLLYWAQSQLSGIQVKPELIPVRFLVEDKIRLLKEVAAQKDITINNEIDSDLLVLADKNHMGLVLRNLLGNAIKFNRRGGTITIAQQVQGDRVSLSVTDTGVGMTDTDMQKLFNAETHFTNLGTLQEKGTGIGLLLSKEFIEKNGGTITATSRLKQGSTFTFTLKRIQSLKKTIERPGKVLA